MESSAEDRSYLEDLIAERGGILLSDRESSVVVDRYGRRALHIPGGVAPRTVAEQIGFFLGDDGARPFVSTIEFCVLRETFENQVDLEAISRVLGAFHREYFPKISVHFSQPGSDLEGVLDWFGKLRGQLPDTRQLELSLNGPFGGLREAGKEALHKYRVHAQVVHGWWPRCSSDDYIEIREEPMNDMAEYGLLVPAVWYVHQDNIGSMGDLIERSLLANVNSGFSALLQLQAPYAAGSTDEPLPPAQDSYNELLVQLYEMYPYYDRTLAPLDELALLCQSGGWDSLTEIPSQMRLLFRGDGTARCYRRLPSSSRHWAACGELVSQSADEIKRSLLEFHHQHYRWSENPYCGHCAWRYVCGGLDACESERSELGDLAKFDIVCSHRKLFLEAFMRQRLTAGILPITTL